MFSGSKFWTITHILYVNGAVASQQWLIKLKDLREIIDTWNCSLKCILCNRNLWHMPLPLYYIFRQCITTTEYIINVCLMNSILSGSHYICIIILFCFCSTPFKLNTRSETNIMHFNTHGYIEENKSKIVES